MVCSSSGEEISWGGGKKIQTHGFTWVRMFSRCRKSLRRKKNGRIKISFLTRIFVYKQWDSPFFSSSDSTVVIEVLAGDYCTIISFEWLDIDIGIKMQSSSSMYEVMMIEVHQRWLWLLLSFFNFSSPFEQIWTFSNFKFTHTPHQQYPVVPPPTTQSFYKARSHLTISVTLNLIYPKKSYHDNARKYENVYFDARTKKKCECRLFFSNVWGNSDL